MLNFLADAGVPGGMSSSIIMLVAMLAIFYFMLIRPQKKKDKESQELRASLQVGDEVTTIGGITGIIVRINRNPDNSKDDSAVIETGGDRTRIRVLRSSIAENRTVHEDVESVTIKK